MEQTREIITLLRRWDRKRSACRYAHMLISESLSALEERGLMLNMDAGEQWTQDDPPCGRQIEDKVKEMLTMIRGARNLIPP